MLVLVAGDPVARRRHHHRLLLLLLLLLLPAAVGPALAAVAEMEVPELLPRRRLGARRRPRHLGAVEVVGLGRPRVLPVA